MAGFDLPVKAIREQIANAIDLIVQQVTDEGWYEKNYSYN